jgi:hypothetical protein
MTKMQKIRKRVTALRNHPNHAAFRHLVGALTALEAGRLDMVPRHISKAMDLINK